MWRGLLLLMLGGVGFAAAAILATATPAHGESQLGPCQVFLGGCFCVWDPQEQYYYHCEERQWQASWCQGSSGTCDWESNRWCYTNFSTNRIKCDDSSCAMGCQPISVQCKLTTPDCLHPEGESP